MNKIRIATVNVALVTMLAASAASAKTGGDIPASNHLLEPSYSMMSAPMQGGDGGLPDAGGAPVVPPKMEDESIELSYYCQYNYVWGPYGYQYVWRCF